MFGKRTAEIKKQNEKLKQDVIAAQKQVEEATPDLVVEQPTTVGMQGFTEDPKPVAEAPKPVPVEEPKPVEPAKPAEQYQIVEVGMAPTEGLYVYKIVTNKYLGELGGVYEA